MTQIAPSITPLPNGPTTTKSASSTSNSKSTTTTPPQPQQQLEPTSSQTFQLQIEITELRNRLKLLDGGTGRCELMDLLQERDDEIRSKTEQLRSLNDKFHKIQCGLGQIEEERRMLRKAKGDLEHSKKKVEKHLEIREKEVGSLVQRCAAQEEKLQEGKDLRVTNGVLQRRIEELKGRVKDYEEVVARGLELGKDLEKTKDLLREERRNGEALQKTSDGLVDIVSKLEGTVSDLDKREVSLREELTKVTEERNEARDSVEELRCVVSSTEQKEVEVREELRKARKDWKTKESNLRSENETVSKQYDEMLEEMKNDFEQRSSYLEASFEKTKAFLKEKHQAEIDLLKKSLEERDQTITSLTEELCNVNLRLKECEAQSEKQRQQSREEVTSHCEENQRLQTANTSLQEQVSSLEEKSVALDKNLTNEREKCAKLSQEGIGLNEQVNALQEKLESARTGAENSLTTHEHQMKQLKSQMDELEDYHQKEIDDMQSELTTLSEDLHGAQAENESLVEKLQRVENERSSLAEDCVHKEEHISKLESDIEISKSAMKESVGSYEEQVNKLNVELSNLQREKQNNVDALKIELDKLAEEKSMLIDEVNDKSDELRTLKENLVQFEYRSKASEEEGLELQDKLKAEAASSAHLKQRCESYEKDLSRVRKRHQDLIDESSEAVQTLREELAVSKTERTEMEEEFKNQVTALKATISDQESQYETILDKNHTTIESLKGSLLKQEESSAAMHADFESMQQDLRLAVECTQKEANESKNQLDLTKGLLAEREKELEGVRLGELKEAEEMIANLEDDVARLKKEMSSAEMKAADIVSDLESDIEKKDASLAASESRIQEITRDYEQETAKLQNDMKSLLDEKKKIDQTILTQNEQLRERHDTISSLVKTRSSQEEKIGNLRAELDLLIAAQEKTKGESHRTILSMEREMDKIRADAKEEVDVCRREIEELRQTVRTAEKSLTDQDEVVLKMQSLLNNRTKLLGDMVSQNKILDGDLQEARGLITELQQESSRCVREKEEAERSAMVSQKDLEALHDEYMVSANRDRMAREKLEHDLEAARVALEDSKRDNRERADLEKENIVLKDKVKRQEAYLMRKLEKERVSKENPNLLKERKKSNIDVTSSSPARKIPPKARGRSSSRPRRPISSFPDELSEVLGN